MPTDSVTSSQFVVIRGSTHAGQWAPAEDVLRPGHPSVSDPRSCPRRRYREPEHLFEPRPDVPA